jgi:hypothetical protein
MAIHVALSTRDDQAPSEERAPLSAAAKKKAWNEKLANCCGGAPFAYTYDGVTINLQVRQDKVLICTTRPCPNPEFGCCDRCDCYGGSHLASGLTFSCMGCWGSLTTSTRGTLAMCICT